MKESDADTPADGAGTPPDAAATSTDEAGAPTDDTATPADDAAAPTDEAAAPTDDAASPISPWKVGVAVMMAGIVAFIGFILLRLALPASWEFTIEATTEIAEVDLRPRAEVRWQVDGAIICARKALELPESYRLDGDTSPCAGRVWRAWRVPDPEQVLRLDGGATATMQLRPEGGLAMSLRSAGDSPLGDLSVVGVVDPIDIGSAVNLIWTTIPEQSLTLPFSGATTLGRAVNWSGTRILRGGNVVVYTADESADKRTMVDEATLMLGDQVRLDEPEPEEAWPKGFVRVSGGDAAMQVVAFGRSGSLRIERFGESGYDFKPNAIRKLAADPVIAFWGSVLAAYMTLILSLQPFVGGADDATDAGPATDLLKRFNRWLRAKPRK